VTDLRTVSAPDVDVESAASAAVSQWQFTPTLLNCVPVDVKMTVTVSFKPQ
jgi:outer membrane biosynthesis protein TonB